MKSTQHTNKRYEITLDGKLMLATNSMSEALATYQQLRSVYWDRCRTNKEEDHSICLRNNRIRRGCPEWLWAQQYATPATDTNTNQE